jgi:hypothetical protein
VQDRGLKLIGVMERDDRRFKERLIGAIFRPTMVPFVHVGLVECVPVGFQLCPSNAGMSDIQHVMKDFVEGEFRLRSLRGSVYMGCDVTVEVFTRDFGRKAMVDERRGGRCGWSIHRHGLLDERGLYGS